MSFLSNYLQRFDHYLSRSRVPVVALLLVTVVVKIIYVLETRDALHVRVPIMDSRFYYDTALDILRGNWQRSEAHFMGPLYPYTMALVLGAFGKSLLALRIVQVVSGVAVVLLTYLVGRRCFQPSVAFAGALMLVLYGAMTFYEGQLLMMWLGTLFNVGALWWLLKAARSGRTIDYIVPGLLLGISATARGNVLAFAPVVIAWILFSAKPPAAVQKAAWFVAAVLLMIAPVTIHNYRAAGEFIPLTSNAGINFYIGNSEDATGTYFPPKALGFVRVENTKKHIMRLIGKDLSDREYDRYWFSESWSFIKNNPGRWLALTLRKTAMFFNGYEVPQIEAFTVARKESAVLQVLFVPFWFVVAMALYGMFSLRKEWRRLSLLMGFTAAFAFSIIIFFITARYRVQLAPVLCLFAAQGLLVAAPAAVSRVRRSLLPVVVLLLLVLLTRPGLFALPAEDVEWRELIHEARRHSRVGDKEVALQKAGAAIQLRPQYVDSYVQRAVIHKESGNYFKAIEDYSRALDMRADLPIIQYDLAQALRKVQMYEPAAETYLKAIELSPTMLEAYNNLGVTYRELGRITDAIAMFEKVLEMDPKYIKAYSNLGAAWAEAGNAERAIETFQRAIQGDPTYANSYKNLAVSYAQVGRIEDAVTTLRQYLGMKPDDDKAQKTLVQLESILADSLGAGSN